MTLLFAIDGSKMLISYCPSIYTNKILMFQAVNVPSVCFGRHTLLAHVLTLRQLGTRLIESDFAVYIQILVTVSHRHSPVQKLLGRRQL